MANSHRRANTIEMLNIDGMDCLEAHVIRDHVLDFVEHLLSKQVGCITKLDRLGFESIEPHNASWLKRPFEEMKVHDVVRKMV